MTKMTPEILIGIKPAPLDAIFQDDWAQQVRALMAVYRSAPVMLAALEAMVAAYRDDCPDEDQPASIKTAMLAIRLAKGA